MANYLLSMQFDRSGCTDKTVINLGGVSFNHTTSLGQAAYFQPYNVQSGFKIVNLWIKNAIETRNWCIYFKYKIDKDDLLLKTPLITFYDNDEYHDFLTIEDHNSFVLYIAGIPFKISDIDYTFDNFWHTFYVYFKEGEIKFFIDGYCYTKITTNNTPVFGSIFYIGTDTINSNFCGYLNDFNIFNGVIYEHNFVPPSNYINQADIMTNYKSLVYTTPNDFEPDLIESIEKNREYSASRLIEHQKGFTPRFLKLTWYQITDGYFQNINYKTNIPKEKLEGIYINITGIDTTLLTHDDKYFHSDLESALIEKKVHPLVIFINKRFVRLSKTKLIKSDDWYTLFIKGLDSKTIVESVDILLLPFDVIYEEDYGERADLQPLYIFNDEGKFCPDSFGTVYYYINEAINPYIRHIGIRVDNGFTGNPEHLKFIWRYGKLEQRRIDNSNGAYMQFLSEEYVDNLTDTDYKHNIISGDAAGHVTPGTKILLYAGSTLINPSSYRVVGIDLIYFENLDDVYLLDNRTVTMQIITEEQTTADVNIVLQEFTNIRVIEIEATKKNQSTFKIPIDPVDRYGNGFRKFLVFKGHVFLEEYERYTVDYDNYTITLINKDDYVAKGRHLIFVFVEVNKVGAVGRVHPTAVTYFYKPDSNNLSQVTLNLDKTVRKSNSMVFINTTFCSPYRYTIENNVLKMKDGFQFDPNASILLVMVELVNENTDGLSIRGKFVHKELKKGRRFVLYDLGINKNFKISLSNFVCFDQNGFLINNLRGEVYNYNIIKYLETDKPSQFQPSYLTCVYITDTFYNQANINSFINEPFLREYIHGREEFYEMDPKFDKLLADFNFDHSKDLSYGENLSNSLDYILSYNQNRIDDVYEKNATSFIKRHNVYKFRQAAKYKNSKYIVSLPRDEYETNKKRTYPIFFVNGKLAEWTIEEDANNTNITLANLPSNTANITSLNFKGLKNFLYPLQSQITEERQVLKDIAAKIVTGSSIFKDISPVQIAVKEDINKDFLASITISQDIITTAKKKVKDNILKCTINVSNQSEISFTCSIRIPLYGSHINYIQYQNSGIYADMFMRLQVL